MPSKSDGGIEVRCPKCSAENASDSRFCKSCGQELSSLSQAPTIATPEGEGAPASVQSPHVGRIVSSDSVPAGGFTPGTILADRYRIIGLLGRGGMGEIYRADDLKLGQPVALKFLPPKLSDDPVRRERFFAEVRITRQLSHPNICRVYDIGEVDGSHFLSMEYIDGEDLASLMKRIGHLSNEKALDIARQLAAGLSVAHERGVLHRDLKPANIMLDGHGRVRITDFGLAIAVGDESQAEEIAGTPAYMAPEQLAGKGATVRSDIYSLGLILYEIYTGKKAFTAKTLAELREQKETHTPRAPSELREGIDPVVERVIQHCMEKDPNARPASVAQLAQALPGGDPLAAAIAAGETPSPEMVAASGSNEGLKPLAAWGILAFIVIGLVATLVLKDRIAVHRRIPFERPPEALVERSREIIKKAGYNREFRDSVYGFTLNEDLLRYLQDSDYAADRRKKLDAKVFLFWYRQSPEALRAELNPISADNPPIQHPGEIMIVLDTAGRLVSLHILPSQPLSATNTTPAQVYASLFTEAGLDISRWKEQEEARWIPDTYADHKAVWEGSLPGFSEARARVEAALLQGKPVSFRITGPWDRSAQTGMIQSRVDLVANIGVNLLCIVGLVGIIFFARRNLRLGRGDRRGALRLALFMLALMVLSWVLQLPRVSLSALLPTAYLAVLGWLFYIGIEPFIRRRWPQVLISWTRLLSGKYQDPLVGQALLIGFAFGTLYNCISFCLRIIPLWGAPEFSAYFAEFNIDVFLGARFTIAELLYRLSLHIGLGMFIICLLVTIKVLLRNQVLVFAVYIIIITPIAIQVEGLIPALIFAVLYFFVLMRFGFLAATLCFFVSSIMERTPMTLDASAWYSPYGFLALTIFAAMVLYAFHTSLGGRPMLGTPRLDD